jgi:hypothetical protein
MSKNPFRNTTDYANIYDKYYGKFAEKIKYSISEGTKTTIIGRIFKTLPFQDQQAILIMVRYKSYEIASRILGIDKRKLIKNYDIAVRHLYSPKNITKAAPKYYTMPKTHRTEITSDDFENRILNSLKKSGIIYREQLYRHLDMGYYYLWTIPGCGDAARQKILMTIDKWNGKKYDKY